MLSSTIPFENQRQLKPEHYQTMKTHHIALLLFLSQLLNISAKRCDIAASIVYASCHEPCTVFDSSLDMINRCRIKSRSGCAVDACPGGYTCSGSSNRVIRACANDRTTITELEVGKRSFDFLIDLNARPKLLDFYLLIDGTSSMSRFRLDIQNKISQLLDRFSGNENARFGVGIYRDESRKGAGYRHRLDFTSDHHVFRASISTFKLKNGKGNPESNLPSLIQATQRPWNAAARKVIFIFGDSPGHEPSVTTVGRLTRNEVAAKLVEEEISVIGVSYSNIGLDGVTMSFGLDSEVVPTPVPSDLVGQTSYMASQTGGIVVNDTMSLSDAFYLAKNITEKVYTVDQSGCQDLLEMSGATFPVTIGNGKSAVVPVTFTLKGGVCSRFSCQYKFSENGIELEPFTIDARQINC